MNLRSVTSFSYAALLWCGGIPPSQAGPAIEECGPAALTQLPFLGDSLHALCSGSGPGPDSGSEPAGQSTWTHNPYCAGTPYCVHANARFARGAGLSIIATPANISRSIGVLEEGFAVAATEVPVPAPWVVRDVPGKGKGAIATRKIERGEAFMTEPVQIMAASDLLTQVGGMQRQLLLGTAVERLPDPGAVLSLARSNRVARSAAEDVIRTNTFTVRLGGESYMGLFSNISRINHACKPNAHTRFSARTLAMSVIALRDIEPGEEISISYAEFGTTFGQRQHSLLHNWGFRCTCALCTAPEDELLVSDSRRERIRRIRDDMQGLIESRQLRRAADAAKEMVGLVVAEGLVAHLAEHYEVLARLHRALGEFDMAKSYARMAVADLERYGGPDDEETLRDMRKIAGLKRVAGST